MIDRVQQVCAAGGGLLDRRDTLASPGSWTAAATAAACAAGAVDAVMTGQAPASLALVRPPGHHALPGSPMGFCIFNNVAIAATHALETYGLSRVMIVDFDVHHGNGTQDVFYSDPRALFFSMHQYPAYPGTGAIDEVGQGAGTGYTINVPLPYGVGDETYLKVFDAILVPAAERYKPELILVSAGYDAHWRNAAYVERIDERVSVDAFYLLSQRLQALADRHCPGRLTGVLEGGYDLEALSWGVAATINAWLGEEHTDDPIGPSPRPPRDSEADAVIAAVRSLHRLA
jgi:acetoin utilization deacetylase AcuC-like enzyme